MFGAGIKGYSGAGLFVGEQRIIGINAKGYFKCDGAKYDQWVLFNEPILKWMKFLERGSNSFTKKFEATKKPVPYSELHEGFLSKQKASKKPDAGGTASFPDFLSRLFGSFGGIMVIGGSSS